MEKNYRETRAGKGRMECICEERGDICGVSRKNLCVKDRMRVMKLCGEKS